LRLSGLFCLDRLPRQLLLVIQAATSFEQHACHLCVFVSWCAAAAAGPVGSIEAPRLDSFPAAKASEVRWWRLQRLKLLALNDRLETCVVSDLCEVMWLCLQGLQQEGWALGR
jgi:hypothetical protein